MFRDFTGDGSLTAADAIPAIGDRTGSDVQEQNRGTADGSWRGVPTAPFTWETIFRRAAAPEPVDRKPDATAAGV